jgi:hypothetical protein
MLPVHKLEHLQKLLALEEAIIREGGIVQGDEEALSNTFHWHCEGAYVRELHMPEGQVVTGAIHRYGCINILLKGRLKVVQSDGEAIVEAGSIYITEPREKKALFALEDSIFLTVHHFTISPEELLLLEEM